MARLVRHRQTKGAETDRPILPPPRHIPTLPEAHCNLEVSWSTDYGVTYGPNGQGGCIVDTDTSDGRGRFPQLHSTNADGGHHGNRFADEMWAAYIARP